MNSTQVKDSTPVVKKTIPKKTMGYLKFAYWALHQEGDNIQKLFLDRSIDEIIHHVSQIVDHGDQHITINTLHKNLRHLINPKKSKAKAQSKSKAEPKSKSEHKAKPESKAKSKYAPDLPDTIVTQLVTLARQDFNTTHETTETIPAILKNKKPRAKKYITPTEPIVEPIIQPLVEPIIEPLIEPIIEPLVEPIIQPLVEPIIETILESLIETPSETFAETPAQTIKKHRPTPIKKIKVKQYATFEPVSPTLQLSQELFA